MDGRDGPERFGPFMLLYAIGSGGMGTAHLAMRAEAGDASDALFVVKRLHGALAHEPTMLERFVHEAEVATHVRHPNVAELVAMGSVGSEPFLATEFVFGVQLSTLIDRIEAGATARAPVGPVLRLGAQLAAGVRAIHETVHQKTGAALGLVHRDIGSRNVLVGYDGRARIIDLGLGKSILADWQTSVEVLAGSPDYMPPEQAMGIPVDARADVYALSVTIWELLAGRRRIREETISKRIERCVGARPEPIRNLCPELSPRFEALLMEAMRPEPELRLPAAALLQEGLQEEARRLRAREDAEIATWLDGACATLRARDSRKIDRARAEGWARLGPVPLMEHEDTKMFVGDLAEYARRSSVIDAAPPPVPVPSTRPPAPSVSVSEPHASEGGPAPFQELAEHLGRHTATLGRLPQSTRLVLAGAFLGVAALTAIVTASLASGPRPEVRVLTLPSPEPPPRVPLPARPEPVVESEPDRPPEPEVEAATPPSPAAGDKPARLRSPARANEARRRALITRVRELRKRSFEIGFQREVTKLSSMVTRTKTKAGLDTVERRLRRLEDRN